MEKKTSKNILLAIMGVLILAELICGILTLGEGGLFIEISSLISLAFIALYGFWLYKKPHGNMLKYAMLILAVSQILIAISCVDIGVGNAYGCTALVFSSAILVYVAGRLNRIEQNKYLLLIAFAIQFVCDLLDVISCADQFTFVYKCVSFSIPVATLTLMIAYFVRYKEHKEAGLMDAPKK